MLKLSEITLMRGTRALLEKTSCDIQSGQHVGLVGQNGCGKSSLFALILGEISTDHGEFVLSKNTRIAHLEQEITELDKPAIEYVIDGDKELRTIQHALLIAENDNDGEAIAHLHGDLLTIDGYTAHARAAILMNGLGFKTHEEAKKVREFSGGWRVRLNLAKTLMCRSDLLLLDEPTNHLDLDALIWLERWLQKYAGTLIIISHDRDFLDNVTTHIVHVENQKLNYYTGNYSDFERMRAEKLALQQAQHEKQQKVRAHMQSFVDRFKAKASKAKQAQSRMKMLEKMAIISSVQTDSPFSFHFLEPKKLPNPILSIQHANVGYDKPILKNVSISIMPGERIGILGLNGAGKSTFMKLLAKTLTPFDGDYTNSRDTTIGYFAQHQLEQLDLDESPLAHMHKIAPGKSPQELRSFLGGFAFSGEMAMAPIQNFSGGEKARLVLALLVWQRPNLLLLDEPTNHFDLEMREALTLALQEYVGALVLVSHDRHLLRSTCDKLLLVHKGNVSNFDGDVDDYAKWFFSLPKDEIAEMNTSIDENKAAESKPLPDKVILEKTKKIEIELEKLQLKLNDVEAQLSMNDIYRDHNKEILQKLVQQQEELQKKISQLENDWLKLQNS